MTAKSAALLAAVCTLTAGAIAMPASATAQAQPASAARGAKALPSKIVDYDFSTAQPNASHIANTVTGSTLGDAVIENEANTETAGTYADSALHMNGSTYVRLPNDILNGHESATVSTQVRNDQFNSSGAPWTYLWTLGSTGQRGTGSWATSTHTSLYTSLTAKANGDGETFFSASENLSMQKFQTLTATIDGSSDTVTLYLNGRQVGQSKASTNPSHFANQSNDTIGGSRYPGVGDALFHGDVRSFTVYDGAMDQQQVAQTLDTQGVSDLLSHQAEDLKVPTSAHEDFALPSKSGNAAISWSSSDPSIIQVDTTGKAHVTLPASDTTVTLVATLAPDAGLAAPSSPVTKTFTVDVPKTASIAQLRKLVADTATVPDADDIRGNILLPATLSLDQYGVSGTVRWTSSDPSVFTVLPLSHGAENYETLVTRPTCGGAAKATLTATVSADANARDASAVLATPVTRDTTIQVQPQSAGNDTTHAHITSHDPSIVKANGKYYIFGSHRAFARSTDLQHWEYFHDNLTDDYENVLHNVWVSWPQQPSNPDVKGNMWAPEVIWNKTMHKWCMYLAVNGDNWKSVIVLLTADDIEGDWTVVGPVIYSGFNADTFRQTDVPKVLGNHPDLTRYASPQDTEINAIDASVKVDGNGDMWMALGSWFGGIWMVKLDPSTGLRDYKTTYPTKPNVSDAYYGHKLAGGYGNSGEGVSISHADNHWYMILSYGGLTQTGGYQMREFRSDHIYGPYTDQNGNSAVYTQNVPSDLAFNRGLRIDSSYSQPGDENVKTSQGGNAALTDSDGSIYNVYHTRFVRTEGNLEEHQVRVTPMVVSPDGWLVMAPYEKSGTLGTSASYSTADVAGTYNVVVHNPVTFYAGGGLSSDAIYHAVAVQLNADGTVSGAARGTWSVKGTAVTLHIDSADSGTLLHGTYQATVGTQTSETGGDSMFLTGDGGDVFGDNGPDATSHGGGAAMWATKALADTRAGTIVPCMLTPAQETNHGHAPAPGNPTNSNKPSAPQSTAGKTHKEADPKGKLAKSGTSVVAIGLATVLIAAMATLILTARRVRKR